MKITSSTNNTKKYQLIKNAISLYLLLTLSLYFFGPIPWQVISWPSMIIVFLAYILFYYGASKPKVYLTPRPLKGINFNIQIRNKVLIWGTIIIGIISTRNYLYFNTFIPVPNVLATSYGTTKALEESLTSFSYLYFILSPLLLYSASSLMLHKSSRKIIILKLAIIIFYIYSGVLSGSNNTILEIFILVFVANYTKYKKKPGKKTILLGILTTLILAVGMGTVIKYRLLTNYSISMPLDPTKGTHHVYNIAEKNNLQTTFYFVTRYLTQGYQGLQLSYGISSDAPYIPFTSSQFMVRQYVKTGILEKGYKTITEKTEYETNWKNKLNWSTSLAWFKEDIPFILIPFLFLYIGSAFKNLIVTSIINITPYNLCSLIISLKFAIFLPLNPITLATGEEFFRFVFFVIIPLIFYKKVKLPLR